MAGGITTREYDLSGFDSIRAGRFDIEVIQSDTFSVTVRADDSVIDRLSVRTSGRELVLRTRPVWWRFGPLTLEATITMPTLSAIDLSEAACARVSNFRNLGDLDVVLSGASELRGDIDARSIRIDASGASRVRFGGRSGSLLIRGSGASMLDLEKLEASTAEIDLSGASHARLNVSTSIESITASGASHVRYRGDPAIGRMETSGASHVAHA